MEINKNRPQCGITKGILNSELCVKEINMFKFAAHNHCVSETMPHFTLAAKEGFKI
jgi:hypothetical protein